MSRRIAAAVARAAVVAGVADLLDDIEIQGRISESWWDATYAPIQPAPDQDTP